MNPYMVSFFLFADLCVPENVANGKVTDISEEGMPTKVFQIECDHGFTLFGTDVIKCIQDIVHGQLNQDIWSAIFPVCKGKLKNQKINHESSRI